MMINVNSNFLGPKKKNRGLGNKNYKQSRAFKAGRQ